MRRWLAVPAALVALAVVGCGDDRPCLESHLQPMPVGKVIMIQTICDKYGPAPVKGHYP